ncbi:hypothetical protein M419DRAFT_124884 [Trichoderma reesei RUT C-30]|uniref:Uncharacterized protein n=1 Tax=Hypocrea jecorina (strain ATCC 56765 / BCRC 32924 / NRRL 11460 / Rut C-30) TaxID=1344414 RepID=A0A024S1Q0_HYPJR|nr:hypothetical protein M419DRAFT_124884 [Trichoderma reesei RUT C-30]
MMPLCCTRMETVASPIDSISCGFGPSSTGREEERRGDTHGATSEAVALVSRGDYRAFKCLHRRKSASAYMQSQSVPPSPLDTEGSLD